MTEKIIPDGYKLVAVKGLDELVYWLERCKDKGHLENCADLIEPFEAFEYRNISEEAVIPAHEAKAAPAVPQGWTIRHIDGGISVTHKDGSGAFVRETENSERIIPSEILYRLCSDLIGVAPSQPVNRPQNCGTSFCSCIECVCEPEPVTLTDYQRTPLTVLQYNAIPELSAIPPSLYESVVRAIERAHGITAMRKKEKR